MNRRSMLMSVVAMGLFGSSQVRAQGQVSPPYRITNKASGMTLTVRGNPQSGYVLVQEPHVPNDPAQTFVFVDNFNGSYRIVNPCTQMALRMVSTESRTPVQLFVSQVDVTQNWHYSFVAGTNHYVFWPTLNGNCFLDVPGGRAQVSMVQIFKANYGPAQLWNLIPVQ